MNNLGSFRELLIKKAGDPSLENLIAFIKEDVLAEMVVESLEKMARARHKGDSANLATRHFAMEMDPETEPNMMHDALSHHASHYKSAMKAGRKDLANQHAKQIFRLMDLADQAQKHSQGKLHVEAVSPHAWERNAKTKQFTADDEPVKKGNKKPGQFVTDTKGWRYRGSDYGFLSQAPHGSYENEVRRHGHDRAYPLEQIRVNGKYLDVQDIPADQLKGYEDHPFGKHPIMSHFEDPASKRSEADDLRYVQEHDAYAGSPHMDKYFAGQEAMENANPEAYSKRGSAPSAQVHDDVEPLKIAPRGEEAAAKPAAAPKIENLTDDQKKKLASLPPEIRNSIMRNIKNG